MELVRLTPQLWQTAEISELSKALIAFANDFQKASLKRPLESTILTNF